MLPSSVPQRSNPSHTFETLLSRSLRPARSLFPSNPCASLPFRTSFFLNPAAAIILIALTFTVSPNCLRHSKRGSPSLSAALCRDDKTLSLQNGRRSLHRTACNTLLTRAFERIGVMALALTAGDPALLSIPGIIPYESRLALVISLSPTPFIDGCSIHHPTQTLCFSLDSMTSSLRSPRDQRFPELHFSAPPSSLVVSTSAIQGRSIGMTMTALLWLSLDVRPSSLPHPPLSPQPRLHGGGIHTFFPGSAPLTRFRKSRRGGRWFFIRATSSTFPGGGGIAF